MKKTLALFDFDGTITSKDTLIEFIRFEKGTFGLILGFLILSPILVLFKLKLFPNWRAKEIMLSYFFKGVEADDFASRGKKFVEESLPKLIHQSALEKIENYKKSNARIIVVTASVEEWVKPWTDKMGLEIISTKMEKDQDKITGKFTGKNCHGPEKVNRVKAYLDTSEFDEIHAYGDSSGDKEMLAFSTHPFYRYF